MKKFLALTMILSLLASLIVFTTHAEADVPVYSSEIKTNLVVDGSFEGLSSLLGGDEHAKNENFTGWHTGYDGGPVSITETGGYGGSKGIKFVKSAITFPYGGLCYEFRNVLESWKTYRLGFKYKVSDSMKNTDQLYVSFFDYDHITGWGLKQFNINDQNSVDIGGGWRYISYDFLVGPAEAVEAGKFMRFRVFAKFPDLIADPNFNIVFDDFEFGELTKKAENPVETIVSDNYIKGADFESYSTGHSFNGTADLNGILSYDGANTEIVSDGSKALKLYGKSTWFSSVNFGLASGKSFEAGKRYRLTFDYKASSSLLTMPQYHISYMGANSSLKLGSDPDVPQTAGNYDNFGIGNINMKAATEGKDLGNGYKRVSIDFNADSRFISINTLRFFVEVQENAANYMTIDNVTLKLAETPAENCIRLIDELPAVIDGNAADEIAAARAAYDKLSTEDQALVTNYSELTDAEETLRGITNTRPVFNPSVMNVKLETGSTRTFTFTAATDVDDDELEYTCTPNATLENNTVTYTAGSEPKTDVITVTASDGLLSADLTINVTVFPLLAELETSIDDIIGNGSFETMTPGTLPQDIATATGGWHSNTHDFQTVKIAAEGGYNGGKVLEMKGNGVNIYGSAMWEVPADTIQAGEAYRFTFKYKESDALLANATQLHLSTLDGTEVVAKGNWIRDLILVPGIDIGNGWREVTHDFIAFAEDVNSIKRFRLFVGYAGAAESATSDCYVLFDDVKFGKIDYKAVTNTEAPNASFIDGGDFEHFTAGDEITEGYSDSDIPTTKGWYTNEGHKSASVVSDEGSKALKITGNTSGGMAFVHADYSNNLTAGETYRLTFDYKPSEAALTSKQFYVSLAGSVKSSFWGTNLVDLKQNLGTLLPNGYYRVSVNFKATEEHEGSNSVRFSLDLANLDETATVLFDNVTLRRLGAAVEKPALPEDPEEPENPENPDDPDDPENPDVPNVDTGSRAAAPFLALAALSGTALSVLSVKKKKQRGLCLK